MKPCDSFKNIFDILIILFCFYSVCECNKENQNLSTELWKYVGYLETLRRYIWISTRDLEREESGDKCRELVTEMTRRKHSELSDSYSYFPNTLLDEEEEKQMFAFYKSLNLRKDIWAGRALDPKESGCSSEQRNCCVLVKWHEAEAEYKFTQPNPIPCNEKHLGACAYERTDKSNLDDFSWRR